MKRFFASVLFLTLATTPALAQRVSQSPMSAMTMGHEPGVSDMGAQPIIGTGIAAVVNDNVITTTDLDQRLRLAILSSGLPDNPEVRAHLLPQILRSLIDEQLQVQEAKRLDLSATDDEINQAMGRIAHDNNIQGDMREFVAAHGASPDALTTQIRNGLLWNKVVQRELRPRVEIGDDEIDAVINRIRADSGKQEYLVSEIFLTVDNPKDEDQVHQVAENLVRQIKNGANFAAVARQFSQGAGAAQGGDIGWIQQGQMAPELNHALVNADTGQVSDPIRTSNGFHILGIRDKRTVSLGDPSKASANLTQAFRAYGSDRTETLNEAKRIRASVKSCNDLDGTLTNFPGWKAQKLGDMVLAKAPVMITSKISGVQAGGSSEPLATDKGVVILFVCSRNDGGDVDRDAIMHSIGTEKLELQARRLLRDLRRAAYLDIRLGKSSS